MNNYIIAIGGTGQHVALCLTDYLALSYYTTSDKFPEPKDNWKIILIDADQEKSQEERSAWGLCREQAERLSDAGLSIKTSAHAPVETFQQTFGDTTTASLLVRLSGSPDIAGLLTDLLFTPAQARVPVLNGFYGEPRVAAFVGGRWLRKVAADPNHDLGALAGALGASPHEVRVAVVGSSAGGTGAGLLEPVRRWLMSVSRDAADSVCVDIGLEWFRISGDRNNALAARMKHNAASCLFPFLKTPNAHRMAVWSHRSVGAATEESDESDTKQAAKKNLTLPWYGASVLADFFGHQEMPNDAALAVDKISLNSLCTPFHNLAELLESNRRVLGRLEHTLAYADHPYDGAVLPISPFRNSGRVMRLDQVDRPRFAARVRALTQAKRDALKRLEESEVLNHAGHLPVAPYGVSSIRELRRLYAKDANPAACGEPIGSAIPLDPTQARLLPEHTTQDTANPKAEPAGTLVSISTQERTRLADLDLIAASRVPSLGGVRDLIASLVANPEVWNGSLALGGKPIATAVLRRPTDDRGVEWMRRWLLVLRALVAGALTTTGIEGIPDTLRPDLTDAGIDIKALLIYEYRDKEFVVGYLDSEYACIPSLGKIWEDESALLALSEQAGAITRLMTWQRLVTRFVGRGQSPAWAKLLESEFASVRDLQTLKADAEPMAINVRWGGNEAVSVPLPSESGTRALDDVLRGHGSGDDTPAEDITADLRHHAVAGGETYLRSDLVRTFKDSFSGRAIVNRNNQSVSLVGASILDDGDLFTPLVVQLKGSPVPYSIPVKVQHVALVASCSYALVGTSLRVTLKLRNEIGYKVTKTYAPDQIVNDTKTQTALYLWPSIADQKQRALWALIIGEGSGRDIRVLTSNDNFVISFDNGTTEIRLPEDITAETDWMQLGERGRPGRVVPNSTAPQRRPRLVAVRLAGVGGSSEAGLIPYRPERPAAASWKDERWCIDFGTSSTVVAVQRKENERDDKVTLKISGAADSTIAVLAAQKVPVPGSELQWFDTWDGQGPITKVLEGEMPSYVLVLNNDQSPEPELGKDYIVDLSWRTGEWTNRNPQIQIRERLKWSNDPLRAAYNREVLETMLQIRLRAGGQLPPVLPVTFTVPYRQIATLDEFANAVTKAVADVKESFGVEIQPAYLWESHALRPQASAIPAGIYIAADLGGGTLDLYAALYRVNNEGRPVIVEEIIDSARVGADELVQSWRDGNQFPSVKAKEGHETVVYKTNIRSRKISTEELRNANNTPYANRYWRTLRRYIALWSDAVRAHWSATEEQPPTATFERLGLGWELYDRSGIDDWTTTLNNEGKALGLTVRFQERASRAAGRSRKEELAYRALWREPVASIDLLKAMRPKMVLGIPLKAGSVTCPADTLINDVIPVRGGMLPVDRDTLQKKLGASNEVIEEVLEQLNNDEKVPGGKIMTAGDVNRLSATPLTLIAEQLIK